MTNPATRQLLELRDVTKRFVVKRNLIGRPTERVSAVEQVSLTMEPGEVIGVVGETGSGKSTLGRLVAGLIPPDEGTILFDGEDLTALGRRRLREHRAGLQVVFQDPRASLDPLRTIRHAITEPLVVHRRGDRASRRERAADLMRSVGLSPRHLDHYPSELSGGQRQRVAVARALALEPKLIVADEPTSALDQSTRSEILNLLLDVEERTRVSLLLISHDLAVVQHLADRVAVMYLGKIVELGPAEQVASEPLHPYSQALMSAAPAMDGASQRERIVLSGDIPNPIDPPRGCRFHTRCPFVMDLCRTEEPRPLEHRAGTSVACHLHDHGPHLAGRSVRELAIEMPPITTGSSP